MKKIKTIAAKSALFITRCVWAVVVLAITLCAMFVTSYVLGECIPDGTPLWVRLTIGLPCIFAAPICVELLLIAISRWVDRKTNYRVLDIH